MKRILVTGASGFIGRRCVELLAESQSEVHVAGRSDFSLLGSGIVPHRTNLMDPGQVESLVAEVHPTHLLHLAWVTNPGEYWTAPENLDWVSCSLQLMRLFTEYGGKRAVLVGSCA